MIMNDESDDVEGADRVAFQGFIPVLEWRDDTLQLGESVHDRKSN
jgi:hypothetical protein